MKKLIVIIFLAVFAISINAQKNIYLVDTLTGTAANNRLVAAHGIGDMNGDGYADFIIQYGQYTDLYFGNSCFNLHPAHRFYCLGTYGIGDINGDGFADMMIISNDSSYYPPRPYFKIILGGKELDTISAFTYYPPYYLNMLIGYVYPLGDINGDGYDDFAISSPYNWYDGIGSVYIFKGGKSITDTTWAILKGSPKDDSFYGETVLGIGDYNGDGFNDFLVTSSFLSRDSDKVYIYLGGKDNINSIPIKTLGPFNKINEIKAAGNLNGKGKKDFIITSNEEAYIYMGNNNPIIYDLSKYGYGGFLSIGTGGDINNDGYDDLILGNTNYRDSNGIMVGTVIGFWGSNIIDTSDIAFKLDGNNKWFEYGKSIEIIGDINGDGYADFSVIQPSYPDYNNPVGKLFLYSYQRMDKIYENKNLLIKYFKLNQNYPNPFNPSTVINYQLAKDSYVTLKIYNILGKEVKTLVNEYQSQGKYTVNFDGSKLASGVYFYQLRVNGFSSIKKMILAK